MTCYRQILTVWPGNLAIFVCTNLGYQTLEGPGRETVDIRSTSDLPVKTWGYDSSKLRAHKPATFVLCVCTEIREKVNLLVKRSVPEYFQREIFFGAKESLCTQDSENVVGLGDRASVSKLYRLKVRSKEKIRFVVFDGFHGHWYFSPK